MKKSLHRCCWCLVAMVATILAVGSTAFAQATPGAGGSADAALLRKSVIRLADRLDDEIRPACSTPSTACVNDYTAVLAEFRKIKGRVRNVPVIDEETKAKIGKIEESLATLQRIVTLTDESVDGIKEGMATEVEERLSAKWGDTWAAAAKKASGDCAGMADRLIQLAKADSIAEAGLAKALEACLQQGTLMVSETVVEALQERGGVVRIPGGMLYVNSPVPDTVGGHVTRSVLGAVGGALGGAALGCGVGGAIRQSEDSPDGFQTSGCGYGSLIGAPVGALVGYLIAH